MKKIIAIILFLTLVLAGCGASSAGGTARNVEGPEKAEDASVKPEKPLIILYHQRFDATEYADVIKDTNTGVCYLFIKNGYGAGLTVMLNADGSPYIGGER